MKIISIANHKGGVGKTTTAVNLAAIFVSKHKKRVLVIDLDGQANATEWLSGKFGTDGKTSYEVLMEQAKIDDCIISTDFGVDLLPSNLRLASIDLDMAQGLYRESRLSSALKETRRIYDYCIIDCPPNLGISTVNAFAASDVVVIPIECKFEAFQAVVHLMAHLVKVTQHRGDVRPYALPTFLERSNLATDVHEAIKEKFETLCLPPIHKNVRLPEAFTARKPVLNYDSTASGTLDYMRVAKELINDLEETQVRSNLRADAIR